MALITQTFTPDTCHCKFIERWDNTLPANEFGSYDYLGTIFKCVYHRYLGNVLAFATAKIELIRKNAVRDKAIELWENTRIRYEYDANRVLIMKCAIFVSQTAKDNLQAWCDANLNFRVEVR